MATSRWSSKETRMRSGWLRGSIYWVLLVLGPVCCYKTIIPDSWGAPSRFFKGCPQGPPFGGFGLTERCLSKLDIDER